MSRSRIPAAVVLGLALVAGACSSGDDTASSAAVQAAGEVVVAAPADAAQVLDDAPEGLVVLDVRTPGEYAAGHLPGAVNLDFYAPDFADRLAELDRDAPYLLYCQSGNRSGQARQLMAELGFADVTDVQGGIAAWSQAGLPVVR